LAWFVMGMGVLLGLGGATAVLFNFEIMMTERGMAMTISGVVALAGSAITVALGLILMRMGQLVEAFSKQGGRMPHPKTQDRPVVPVVSEKMADSAPSAAMGMTALGAAAGLGGALVVSAASASEKITETPVEVLLQDVEPPTLPVATPIEFEAELQRALADVDAPPPEADADVLHDLAPLADPDASPVDERDIAPEVAVSELSDADSAQDHEAVVSDVISDGVTELTAVPEEPAAEATEEPELAVEHAAPAPPAESASIVPEEAMPPKPAILGSYKAGGRTYTMYADGTVEAITDEGVERFVSLDALRQHLAET
jgi:hypothetical protein